MLNLCMVPQIEFIREDLSVWAVNARPGGGCLIIPPLVLNP
jgi:hypothetical protein